MVSGALAEVVQAEVVLREAGDFVIHILSYLFRCYYGGMNKEKLIITLFLVFSAFGVYYSTDWIDDIKASILSDYEKEFSKPIDVVWRGEIISTMAGGSCVGMKGDFDNYDLVIACFSDDASGELWNFEGVVTITGKWLGITCAYKDTIFGECVPDVRIENIKQ